MIRISFALFSKTSYFRAMEPRRRKEGPKKGPVVRPLVAAWVVNYRAMRECPNNRNGHQHRGKHEDNHQSPITEGSEDLVPGSRQVTRDLS